MSQDNDDEIVHVGGRRVVPGEDVSGFDSSVDPSAEATSPEAILLECIELRRKKASVYQNPHSSVVQADYYPRGIRSIYDTMHAKMLRMKSILETMEGDPDYKPEFESYEDSLKDLINYCSFAASWLRGGIEGQTNRDPLNR